MAQVIIPSFPYKFVSTGTQNDTLVLPKQYADKVLTLFANIVTSSGSVQISIGSECTSANPAFTSSKTFLPTIFGGEYGEINIKASASSFEVELSVA